MTMQDKRMWIGAAVIVVLIIACLCYLFCPREAEGGEIYWMPETSVVMRPYQQVDYWSARRSIFGRRIILRQHSYLVPYADYRRNVR